VTIDDALAATKRATFDELVREGHWQRTLERAGWRVIYTPRGL
jgi:hypothetical protein